MNKIVSSVKRVSLYLDIETVAQLRKLARAKKVSLASAVAFFLASGVNHPAPSRKRLSA